MEIIILMGIVMMLLVVGYFLEEVKDCYIKAKEKIKTFFKKY